MAEGLIDCPICGGGGEVPDGKRYNPYTLDQPMRVCPACLGYGTMSEAHAESTESWSLRDHEAARAADEAEYRYDQMREEGRDD